MTPEVLFDLGASWHYNRNADMNFDEVDKLIRLALAEDMPQGDITTDNLIPPEATSQGVFIAKERGVLAGLPVAERVFKLVDKTVNFTPYISDGTKIHPGDRLAAVAGPARALLKAERTALNFLQRLSGIATLTRHFVQALAGTSTRVLDTRKTTPGLRGLEKYAVRMGGGQNHRFSLSDMVLIKDNHLRLVGSITEAVHKIRERVGHRIKIEVEVTSLAEAQEALHAGADWIMLDNMSLEEMKEVVRLIKGQAVLEASGNITLEKARTIASLGVDFISVGGLTHSVKALDISLEFI